METSTKITLPSGLGFGLMGFWLFLGMSCMADHDHRARVQVACIESGFPVKAITTCAEVEPK